MSNRVIVSILAQAALAGLLSLSATAHGATLTASARGVVMLRVMKTPAKTVSTRAARITVSMIDTVRRTLSTRATWPGRYG